MSGMISIWACMLFIFLPLLTASIQVDVTMYLGAISQHNTTAIQPDIAIDISTDDHAAAKSGYVPSYFTLDFNRPSKRGEITAQQHASASYNRASNSCNL